MDLSYEHKGDIVVFKPPNYIELEFKKALDRLLSDELKAGNQRLLFNLENVELINSHGASALLSLYHHLQANRGVLAFCCVNDLMVQETFRDTGITWLCEKHIYESEAEALKKLNSF